MRLKLFVLFLPIVLRSQTPSDQSLTGRYHFVHLLTTGSRTGHIVQVENVGGTIAFDGAGSYTVSGRKAGGMAEAEPFEANGTFSVGTTGIVRLSSPHRADAVINARLGFGSAVLLGSTTDNRDGISDLFVAVPAAEGAGNGRLRGRYGVASLSILEFVSGTLTTSLSEMDFDGQGALTAHQRLHDRRDVIAGVKGLTRLLDTAGAYNVGADGAGELALGDRRSRMFVSPDGEILIAFSAAAGAREISVGLRLAGSRLEGNYWVGEMLLDTEIAGSVRVTSSIGSVRSDGSRLLFSQRLNAAERWRNTTALNRYETRGDGFGQMGPAIEGDLVNFAVGDRGFIGAQVGLVDSVTHLHGVLLGFRMPAVSGTGLFLSPHGVLNATAQLPPATPVSAGAVVLLQGTGFSEQSATAEEPWPAELAGIRVTVNGVDAAVGAITPERITARIPDSVTGDVALFRVHKVGSQSNEVAVELAGASPAVVSQDGSGTGIARMDAIAPNEQISILAAGIREGGPIRAWVAGRSVQVLSVSAGPETGLVRITVRTPPSLPSGASVPLAIAAGDAFTCLADAPVKGQ